MSLERTKTIVGLKKKVKIDNKNIWKDLAKRMARSARNLPVVNLEKINKLAEKNPGKLLVVPGKVLGKGSLTTKVNVAAFSFSEHALDEIKKHGEAIHLSELIQGNEKPSNMVIVQ